MKTRLLPLSIIAAMGLASEAVLAKSTIGGIVFTNTYYQDQEVKDTNGNTASETKGTIMEVANNSRFRVRWDNEDNVSMYIEMAVKNDGNSVRHAYGKWDANQSTQILAGQTSTPFAPLNPSVAMVNNSGDHYGNVNPGRQPQIRYTHKFLNRQGALAIAFVNPATSNNPVTDDTTDAATDQSISETAMPRMDVGLAYRTFDWQVFPSVFYAQQEFDDADAVTAYGISVGAKTAFGPLTFTTELGQGQNWGNTSQKVGSSTSANAAKAGDDDADTFQGWVDIGYRYTTESSKGTIHFVYGTSNIERGNTIDTESTMVGLSWPIDLPWIARGLRVRPELFTFEDKDNKSDAKQTHTIVGAQMQFTF